MRASSKMQQAQPRVRIVLPTAFRHHRAATHHFATAMLDTQAQLGERALPATLQTRLNPRAALDHAQIAAQKFAMLDSSGLRVVFFWTGYVSAARTRPTLLCTPAPACLLPQITAAGRVLQAICRQQKTTLFVLCGAERGCASRTRRRGRRSRGARPPRRWTACRRPRPRGR